MASTTTTKKNFPWPIWLSILEKTFYPASQHSCNSTALLLFFLPVILQILEDVFHRRLTYTFLLKSQSSSASIQKTRHSKYILKILMSWLFMTERTMVFECFMKPLPVLSGLKKKKKVSMATSLCWKRSHWRGFQVYPKHRIFAVCGLYSDTTHGSLVMSTGTNYTKEP